MRNALLAITLGVFGLVAASNLIPGQQQEAERPATANTPPRRDTAPAWPRQVPVRPIQEKGAAEKNSVHISAQELDREIARLGLQPPRYPDDIRRRFEEAENLFQFMLDVLPLAQEGDGASQYYVYLALEECRAYLRLDYADANAVFEQSRSQTDAFASNEFALTSDELALMYRVHLRCRNYAGGDLSPLVQAMGDDVPGAEVEYASVWFERAEQSGYPPALANLALRPFKFSQAERLALLQQAVAKGDPDVFWRVFGQASRQGAADEMTASAMAWLIAACRAGADCREEALWYRNWRCSADIGMPCRHGESAIEHYWYGLPPNERVRAYKLATLTEAHVKAGEFDALPWPPLPGDGR